MSIPATEAEVEATDRGIMVINNNDLFIALDDRIYKKTLSAPSRDATSIPHHLGGELSE
jgi:hypothetical protein